MNAGRLRHRIRIQTPTAARNGYGEQIITWTTLATVWAAVEPLRGRELYDAEQVQAEISHRVRIRPYPGVTPQMRVLFDSRVLMIETVINVEERGRDMQLMCREMPDA